MIIRYNKQTEYPQFLNKHSYTFEEDTIVNLGEKCLPINLQDVFNKGSRILSPKSVEQSPNCHICCIDNLYNNIRKNNNILINNLYNKCDKVELCDKAKGNLIDIHFFPIRFKGKKENELSYVLYNLRNSLIVMIEMESALQWLIGYSNNIQFVIEDKDIELTLNKVANRLSNDKEIISQSVSIMMNEYSELDVKYIASKFKDYEWNINYFIGKDRWTKHLTGYEPLNRNQYIGVYLYGDNKEQTWKSIKHKDNPELCLFVDNMHKMMLKRIQKSMNGKHNQFKNYLKDLIGKWFNVDQYWDKFRTYLNRIDDSKLDERICVEGCKLSCKQYFNNIGEYCYNIDKSSTVLECSTIVEPQIMGIHQIVVEQEEEPFTDKEMEYKYEDNQFDWSKLDAPVKKRLSDIDILRNELKHKDVDDFWSKL